MNKFKPGDIVRRVGNFNKAVHNKTYTVKKFDRPTNMYLVEVTGGYDPSSFILVDNTPFEGNL